MSILPKRKRCKYCGELFIPDSRVKRHQIACKKADCQRARKKDSQNRWFVKNRDYFKGRYANTRQWLDGHPQYLKNYRSSHPEYVKRNRLKQQQRRQGSKSDDVDIQDAITTQPVVAQSDKASLVRVDIQDAIWPQFVVPIGVIYTSCPSQDILE
jgi:hypothetical protein